jgi:hypothetical protein
MPGHETILQALAITALLGGGSAWMAGRAIARTWRPFWHVLASAVPLGLAVRFFHFALFEAPLINPTGAIADILFLAVIGGLSWRFTRARQMTRQYYWLYEARGPLSWRLRHNVPENVSGKPD